MLKRIINSVLIGIGCGSVILNGIILFYTFTGNSEELTTVYADYARQLVFSCIVGIAFNMTDIATDKECRYAVWLTSTFARGLLTFFVCAFVFGWITPTLLNIGIYSLVCLVAFALFILCNYLSNFLTRRNRHSDYPDCNNEIM